LTFNQELAIVVATSVLFLGGSIGWSIRVHFRTTAALQSHSDYFQEYKRQIDVWMHPENRPDDPFRISPIYNKYEPQTPPPKPIWRKPILGGSYKETNFVNEVNGDLYELYNLAARLANNSGIEPELLLLGPPNVWIFE